MPGIVKKLLFSLVMTPVLYALCVQMVLVLGYPASYADGQLLIALSFFVAFSIGGILFRDAPRGSNDK